MTKPLYQQVKEYLQNAIMQGKWAVGDCLPGELDLSQQINVSRFHTCSVKEFSFALCIDF